MPEVFLRRIADAVTAGAQKGAGLLSEARAASNLIPRRAVKVGDIVHYVPRSQDRIGASVLPAIVVRVFVPDTDDAKNPGMSNLQVSLDGPNSFVSTFSPQNQMFWVGPISFDEGGKPGTWHWPEGE